MSNLEVYGEKYQLEQLEKHRNRRSNHWRHRIDILHDLVDNYASLKGRRDSLDVGCSIGTVAIEMAQKGYHSIGIDFDDKALEVARILAKEEGVDVQFINSDVALLNTDSLFDVVTCMDIFEHLHDSELGVLLNSIKSKLKPNGVLIFHSFPTQYEYLFFGKVMLMLPLFFVKWLPVRHFERITRSYASLIDSILLLFRGFDYKEKIKNISHCNPTTQKRLEDIFRNSGFDIESISSKTLYNFQKSRVNFFQKHPISYRNIFGAAKVKKSKI
jgi:2-polyprenyl-3-methyl-5-hydroxy-6-metoxy-1,4-benzoquinol methylase